MPTYWDAFIDEKLLEGDKYYFSATDISQILEDFYDYLDKKGKIRK